LVLAYILVCSLPFLIIFLVICVILLAAVKTGRTGKKMYDELKPYVADINEKVSRAQRTGLDLSERANNLQSTFEEITGRWAFIIGEFQETRHSPLVKLAGAAARFAGRAD